MMSVPEPQKQQPQDDFEDFCPECGDFLGYEGKSCPCTDDENWSEEDGLDYDWAYYTGEKLGPVVEQKPEAKPKGEQP